MKLARTALAVAAALAFGASAARAYADGAMATDPASKAYMAAMERMHHDMPTSLAGDPDLDFVRGMIPHHEGAVGMADVELKYGKDPELKKLAQDIVEAQKRELDLMRAWEAKRPR